eukprot:TRINITY_DN7264_c0_g1_i1.p1 TRINITY_DN7264_c0_g1~~TRINITY_DN7264_c0_g1_i1.p1  ORF type:complete len:855 (+),score=175.18 TRINITY_DN7264_c0_g1_i1:132-2696(+)
MRNVVTGGGQRKSSAAGSDEPSSNQNSRPLSKQGSRRASRDDRGKEQPRKQSISGGRASPANSGRLARQDTPRSFQATTRDLEAKLAEMGSRAAGSRAASTAPSCAHSTVSECFGDDHPSQITSLKSHLQLQESVNNMREDFQCFLKNVRGDLKTVAADMAQCEKTQATATANAVKKTAHGEKTPAWLPTLGSQFRKVMREELAKHQQDVKALYAQVRDSKGGSTSASEVPHEWASRNRLIHGASRVRETLKQADDSSPQASDWKDYGSEDLTGSARTSGIVQPADPPAGLSQEADVATVAANGGRAHGGSIDEGKLWHGRQRHAIRFGSVHRESGGTSHPDVKFIRHGHSLSADPSTPAATCFEEADDEILEPLVTLSEDHVPFFMFRNESEEKEALLDSKKGRLSLSEKDAKSMSNFSMAANVAYMLNSSIGETIVCIALMANAVLMGLETDFGSRALVGDSEEPAIFFRLEIAFCIFFSLEIAVRFYVLGWSFFTAVSVRAWNCFDAAVAASQVVSVLANLLSMQPSGKSLSFMRALRIVRIIRVTRLVRVLRFIEELRTIVSSIAGSMRSLGWTLILLFLMIYTVAICLTQLVLDYQMSQKEAELAVDPNLLYWYGSLMRTILTLFECIASGVSWDEVVQPLIDKISPVVGLLFCFYISFSVFAMMNVVTGVFVEKAMQHAQEDKEEYLATHISEAFKRADTDDSGEVTWEEFEGRLQAEEMQEYFKAIDVDISEAKGLFKLIDADGSGSIDAVEFVSGCMRLRGPAKALELALLLHETNRMHEWLTDKILKLESMVDKSAGRRGAVTDLRKDDDDAFNGKGRHDTIGQAHVAPTCLSNGGGSGASSSKA